LSLALAPDLGGKKIKTLEVLLGGKKVKAGFTEDGRTVTARWKDPVAVKEGEELLLRFGF
jgi:hypothetical protein